MNDWEVHITDRIGTIEKEVTLFRKLDGGTIEVYNPISQVAQTIPRHASFEPTEFSMKLNQETMQAIFDAFQKIGFKPTAQSFIEGKLESQTAHLEDMRTLLKLNK